MALLGLLLTGCGAAEQPQPADPAPVREATAGEHLRTAPLRGRTDARLTLRTAAARVTVRVADLPGLLYRISTPAGSGLAPAVTGIGGIVDVTLTATGGDGPDSLDILLSRGVRWDLRLAAGAGEQHLDLRLGRVGALGLAAGVGRVRLWLPHPTGTVPVRLTGPSGTAEIVAPTGVPVRVRAAGPVTTVTLPSERRADVPAGTDLTPPGWRAATDRYGVTVGPGVDALTVRA